MYTEKYKDNFKRKNQTSKDQHVRKKEKNRFSYTPMSAANHDNIT